MVSSSLGFMVFCWLSWSRGLLAASHGLVIAPSPKGSHGLMNFRSHGLLVALMVSWSSRCLSWFSYSHLPPGFSWTHGLAVSWSSGGSHGLLVFSLPLMVYL